MPGYGQGPSGPAVPDASMAKSGKIRPVIVSSSASLVHNSLANIHSSEPAEVPSGNSNVCKSCRFISQM